MPNTVRNGNAAVGVPVVAVTTAVIAFINSVSALAISFGLNLSAEQLAEIQTTTNALMLLLVSIGHLITARKVESVTADIENGKNTGGLTQNA